MIMATLGRTKIEAFRLGLGGIHLMNASWEEARDVINACREGGVNFADTAESYGDTEEKLSMALEHDRSNFFIATKSMQLAAKGMEKAVNQSLSRLKTDYIDIYQIHMLRSAEDLDRIMSPGGALEALDKARGAGKIRFIGVTGHEPKVLAEAVKTGLFDTVMAPVNVIDREVEEDLLPLAKELDIGILSMKPLCGGSLDNADLGIRFALNSLADVVLCGMKNLDEVTANLESVRSFKPLSGAEEENLLAAASQMGNQFCRQCGYCQPCPQGINIPRILWLANVHRRYDEEWPEKEYGLLGESADFCEKCGECEDICPYGLPTREMLEAAHAELTPSTKYLAKRKIRRFLSKTRIRKRRY